MRLAGWFGASAGVSRGRGVAAWGGVDATRLIDSATSDIQSVLENSSIAIVDFFPNERP